MTRDAYIDPRLYIFSNISKGGGINEGNLEELLRETGAKEYHGSAKIQIDSQMEYHHDREICMGNELTDEYKQWIASVKRIECLVNIARKVGIK